MGAFLKSRYRIPFDRIYYVYLLCLGAVFFLFKSIWAVYWCESPQVLLVYELLFGLSLVCLMMSFARGSKILSLHVFAVGTLMSFGFLWHYHEGVNGSFSYVYLTLLAIYAVVLPGVFKIVYSVILCVLCLAFTSYSNPIPEQVDSSVVISFIVNTALTGGTVVYLKWFYDKNRESFYEHNEKLDHVNQRVFKKKVMLLNQRKQIQDMKDNLQKLVTSHTAELETKNRSLSEMAFSNAHYLRAPLTNVMAIVEMMKSDPNITTYEIEELEAIATESLKLDAALYNVNQLLDD